MAEMAYLGSLGLRDRRLTKLLESGTDPAVAGRLLSIRLAAFLLPLFTVAGVDSLLEETALSASALVEVLAPARPESRLAVVLLTLNDPADLTAGSDEFEEPASCFPNWRRRRDLLPTTGDGWSGAAFPSLLAVRRVDLRWRRPFKLLGEPLASVMTGVNLS